MAVRENIIENASVRDAFVEGVLALKSESSGMTTADLGIPARPGVSSQDLSTWDMFVYWHMQAMFERGAGGRNAAHSGPVFLPWHRWMLMLLEEHLQRVLDDDDFGLPYWDWAADGEFTPDEQRTQPIWSSSAMGGNGRASDGEVTTGPFRRTGSFRIRIEGTPFPTVPIVATNRGLRRSLGGNPDFNALPRKANVEFAIGGSTYDSPPWNAGSTSMRNFVEGWTPNPPNTHNRVHVWVGGDMGPASSPNDPVFYLNHCNVDRIWARWQADNPASDYMPPQSAPNTLFRHRREDPLFPPPSELSSDTKEVADMLDVNSVYEYDNVDVF